MSGCRNRSRTRQRVCLPWHPKMLPYGGLRFLVLSKDRASHVLSSGLATWKDISGNGRDVTAVSTKPTIVENALNGFPCVRFNSSQMTSTATMPMGATYSVIVLAKDSSATAIIQEPFSVGTSMSATSFEFVLDYATSQGINQFAFFNGGTKAYMAANYSDSPALMSLGLSAGVSNCRANGVNGTNNGSSITTNDATFAVGYSRPQVKYPLNGDLYAVAVIGYPIGSVEYLKTEAWIAWQFLVQDMLGKSSPFRLRPPMQGD